MLNEIKQLLGTKVKVSIISNRLFLTSSGELKVIDKDKAFSITDDNEMLCGAFGISNVINVNLNTKPYPTICIGEQNDLLQSC